MLKIDCAYFKGERPCKFHKEDGVKCDECNHYKPIKNKILIIKLDAIGDVLRTTSILPPLRKKYPDAFITWCTKSNATQLFSNNDFVDEIITTEEELEGFQIIRAIVCQKIAPNRVVHRDTKSYFGILLDDNNRKPICRLHFNSSQKYIGLFDKDKNEKRHPINEVTDIYQFSQNFLDSLSFYEETE